jgi:hypothetical protein
MFMSISTLAALGSFIGVFAVLASLVFLYFHLRGVGAQVRQIFHVLSRSGRTSSAAGGSNRSGKGSRPGLTGHTIEIARRDDAEFRSVRLILEEDGGLKMETQDIGSGSSRIWGDDERDETEFWVHVAPAALPKLAVELLREKFSGQLGAVDAFRDWCKAHGVDHEFDSWV